MATYQRLSAELRAELRSKLGSKALNAVQDHLYHKALDYFDATAHWDITAILELSELAHRLRDHAEAMNSDSARKFEAMRLAKTIWNDFAAVYKTAMKRGLEISAAA